MKKSVVIGVATVIVALGGGAVGGGFYLKQQIHDSFNAGIKQFEDSNPGVSIRYDKEDISLFARTLTLSKVKFNDRDIIWTADKVVVHGNNIKHDLANNILSVSVDGMEGRNLSSSADYIHIAHFDTKNFKWDRDIIEKEDDKIKKVHFAKAQFDSLNMNNLEVNIADTGTIKLPQIQIKNYGSGRLSDLTSKDIEISFHDISQYAYFQAGLIQLNHFKLADLFAFYQDKKTDFIEEPMADLQDSMDVTNVILKNSSLPKITLDHLQLSKPVKEHDKARQEMTFSGLKIFFNENEHLFVFKELGYNVLEANLKIGTQCTMDMKECTIDPYGITIKDVGKVNMVTKMQFSGKGSSDQNKWAADFFNTKLEDWYNRFGIVSFKMTVQNDGLLGRLIKATSQEENISESQVKGNWASAIQGGSIMIGSAGKQLNDAALDILQNPDHEFTIQVNPDRPYLISELERLTPEQLLSVLNLKIYASPRH